MAAGLAYHVGLALELAHAQEARRQLLMFADRDRIARDLHDLVIQRLFATRLGTNSLAGRTGEPATRIRLGEFADELDDTIRAIRQATSSCIMPATVPGCAPRCSPLSVM